MTPSAATGDDAPASRRSRLKSDRRTQLLAAAERLFAERGFLAVRLEDIGAAAGVSGPAIYRHFPSKEAMLVELLVEISTRLLAGAREVDAGDRPPTEVLDGLIEFHLFATVTLISEEFPKPIPLKEIVDTLVGAILKRLSYGRRDGVAIIAEGVVLDVAPDDLSALEEVERDAHGHIRIAEVNIGEILKAQVNERLAALGVKTTTVAKNIGYELRCADPIPYDMEYARDLGYCAAKYLIAGGNAAMISMQGGHFVPVPFSHMIDAQTGRTRVRMVNVASTRYAIARRYMIRLRRDDFEDPHELAKLAATAHMSPEEFRRQFEYLIASEPPRFEIDEHGERRQEVS